MPKKASKQDLAYEFRYALSNDLELAGRLLNKNPFVLDHPVYGKSESALHYYSTEDRADVVKWLVSKGANVEGLQDDGSPIHDAAALGHSEVVKALVEAGADVNRQDIMEETPLHKAAVGGYVEVVKILLKAGAKVDGMEEDESPLFEAVTSGNVEIVRLLVTAGADVNKKHFGDDTALHKASSYGYIEIVEVLLKAGADPSISNIEDELPIDLIMTSNGSEILAMFEKYAGS